jgi:cyclophilin family peptidyl-prolyl cis-trans isomerase/tRNA A-37 threonylcarbamoyl transferase component Bud32/HEAT repeat protein
VLRLKTLGGLSLWRGTDQVASAGAPPYALHCLAVLGLAGDRVVSADDVIALLWPERPRDTARTDFNALVTALPAWLGGVQPLQETPDGLRLDPAVISSDVRDFEFAAASGAPDQASRLFEGAFLQGVTPPAKSFDRWREREAARLAQIAKWCRDATRPRRSKVQLVPGAQIGHGGRYRIDRAIGGGAAATVYLAHDTRHDRPVAIKVLREDISETISPERFEKEIKFVALLQHPHILPLFDSGELGPVLYSVMPFVDGETVRQRLDREGKIPPDDAVRIASEVADALAYAHEHGVLHRDVKPENILLSDGHPFITDFGIARAVDSTSSGRTTLPGVVLGTAPYMSPEQATGEADLDGRTDVYALGAVLYEMLSGSPPFAGEQARRMMARRLTEVPPRVSKMGAQVPDVVDELLVRALQPVPEDRATAREFADALASAERHLTGESRARAPKRNRRPAIFAALVLAALVTLLFATKCAGLGSASPVAADSTLLQRMLVAEDARGTGSEGLGPLVEGTKSSDASIRLLAIRAFGQLGRQQFHAVITAGTNDSVPAIRAEAANALAQAAQGGPHSEGVVTSTKVFWTSLPVFLETVLARETARVRDGTPNAFGMTARSLGRLPFADSAAARSAEQIIAREVAGLGGLTRLSADAAHDVAEGLYSIARSRRTLGTPSPVALEVLRAATGYRGDARVRRLGLLALASAGVLDSATTVVGSRDSDSQVRRLALAGAPALSLSARTELVRRALADTSAIVRFDAVRAVRTLANPPDCAPIISATHDPNPHVVLAAIDALGNTPCADQATRMQTLRAIAFSLAKVEPPRAGARDAWHAPAHALVSLARADSVSGAAVLPAFAANRRPQLREYAARAAAQLKDAATLLRLAADSNHDVQEAAIAGLSQLRKHDADRTFMAALRSPGYQVVHVSAAALAGSPNPAAVPALLDALDRISAERRENSRDPRVAILTRIAELGHATDAPRLERYLADFDTTIAKNAAGLFTKWTGRRVAADPSPLPIREEPLARIFAMRNLQLRVTMAPSSGGGTFAVRLFPDEAPATIARIIRLARTHYYDGLTFHRVEPNFVIQGGSPDANEYAGDGPFMRDELGLRSHDRGTLGISTRGRDTGDAQFFVNLVDNPRLDHDYTVFGEVISGMPVVDGILEGDVIAHVEVISPAPPPARRPSG